MFKKNVVNLVISISNMALTYVPFSIFSFFCSITLPVFSAAQCVEKKSTPELTQVSTKDAQNEDFLSIFDELLEEPQSFDADKPFLLETSPYEGLSDGAYQAVKLAQQVIRDRQLYEESLSESTTSGWFFILEPLPLMLSLSFSILLVSLLFRFTSLRVLVSSFDTPGRKYSRVAFFGLFLVCFGLVVAVCGFLRTFYKF